MTLWQHVFYHPAAHILDCSSIERPFRGHHNLYHDALVNMNILTSWHLFSRVFYFWCVWSLGFLHLMDYAEESHLSLLEVNRSPQFLTAADQRPLLWTTSGYNKRGKKTWRLKNESNNHDSFPALLCSHNLSTEKYSIRFFISSSTYDSAKFTEQMCLRQ